MAKKEKVVDLKPQNITDEELKNLQNVVNSLNRVQMEIGNIESRKHGLLHQITAMQSQMQTMQKTFEEIYGKVDISIQDGSITYTEDEQADKKN